ncbi:MULTISPECIES: transposase [unclassified Streptomyces]|uniref:transposase n=1 Tax=unclassified Streptomyces TaxID=2593676 RepID=UPI003864C8CA
MHGEIPTWRKPHTRRTLGTVREVQISGRPVAEVARELGVHKAALRLRVRQAEADRGSRLDCSPPPSGRTRTTPQRASRVAARALSWIL